MPRTVPKSQKMRRFLPFLIKNTPPVATLSKRPANPIRGGGVPASMPKKHQHPQNTPPITPRIPPKFSFTHRPFFPISNARPSTTTKDYAITPTPQFERRRHPHAHRRPRSKETLPHSPPMNHIKFNLNERHDLDAPGRRRIARAWGVIYINEDGSLNEEPQDTPPPAE